MNDIALYIHVPFCVKKCAYCDFNSFDNANALIDEYVVAICSEIENSKERGRHVPTIYFGGGTPTVLGAEQLSSILEVCRTTYDISSDPEITVESNPTTAEIGKYAQLRQAGFNRLSIGIQAFSDPLLQKLGRAHTVNDALSAYKTARLAGFTNVSIDLMFGLPTQTPDEWDASLSAALELCPEHISLYALTVEKGTPFERAQTNGLLPLPDEDDELWMYERAIERLTLAGYEHYEVSNFALPGRRAKHNVVYWHNAEYRGFGPGAVSYVGGTRWTNEKIPAKYCRKLQDGIDPAIDTEHLDGVGSLAETMMLGLRLCDGVELSRLSERYSIDVREKYAVQFTKLIERDMLIVKDDTVRLTHTGLLFANDVFVEFLPE